VEDPVTEPHGPHIVTPEEAQRRMEDGWASCTSSEREALLRTIVTEHERRDAYARAAVVKALRQYGDAKAARIATEIENGAPL
jgi:hypothetical protein